MTQEEIVVGESFEEKSAKLLRRPHFVSIAVVSTRARSIVRLVCVSLRRAAKGNFAALVVGESFEVFSAKLKRGQPFNLPQLFQTASIANCSRGKSSAEIGAKLSPKAISSCVIVDAGKAPMKSPGTTHHDLFCSA